MGNFMTKESFLKYLSQNNASCALSEVHAYFSKKGVESTDFHQVLYELLASGQMSCNQSMLQLQAQPLFQWIAKEENSEVRFLLENYFHAQKIEGMSTQALRKAIREVLKSRPLLDEDAFRDIFKKYHFDQESFTNILEAPSYVYLYLAETCKKGSLDWRDVRNDDAVDENVRNRATELMRDKGLYTNGIVIEFSTKDVLLFLLKNHSDEVAERDLYLEYTAFIEAQAPVPTGLELNYSQFIRVLGSCTNIIRGKTGCVRFRATTERMDRRLLNKLKLNQYKNQYISAELIYQNAEVVLKEGNIQTAGELICLLKQYPDVCAQYSATVSKPPFISFGNGDAIVQIKQLLNELSPASADELANAYEQRYGLKASTVKARLLKEISQYVRNGIYDTQTRTLTEKQFTALSAKLQAPWYAIEDVEKIFRRHIKNKYLEYMSTQNLLQLGYRKTNAIVYSSQFSSLDECLFQTEWMGETFHVSDDLWNIGQIYNSLQKKTASFEIIEYSPQNFIRLSYLKRNAIHKKDLYGFIDAVNQKVSEGMYFTLKSLKEDGFTFDLARLGFEDTFYFSILKQRKKIQAKKLGGAYLFCKTKTDVKLGAFIKYLLEDLGSADLFDLSDLLQQRYGLNLAPAYIRTTANGTNLYYDNISGKLFIDYDTYFEQI